MVIPFVAPQEFRLEPPPLEPPVEVARLARDFAQLIDETRVSISTTTNAPDAFAIFEMLKPYAAELNTLVTAAIVRADVLLRD